MIDTRRGHHLTKIGARWAVVRRLFLGGVCAVLAAWPAMLFSSGLTPELPVLRAAGAKGHVVLRDGSLLATRTGHLEGGEGSKARNAVLCSHSVDRGSTWRQLAIIVEDDADTDLGDGHLCQLRSGEIIYSYRRNRYAGPYADQRTTRLEAAVSKDGGRTWAPHSVIAGADFNELARRPGLAVREAIADGMHMGFWSSFLIEDKAGSLHCVYDDEITPLEMGFPRHQWITRKTWDPTKRDWVNPVVVSRTESPGKLARDGMPSVVEMKEGHWLCVFESCDIARPHPNVIRMVESADGGVTWDWAKGRRVVYQPPNGQSAMCPWLVAADANRLICVFATNEDWPQPEKSGLPPSRYHMEIKYVFADGIPVEWTQSHLLYRGGQRNYIPGVVWLEASKELHFQWLEFGKGFVGLRAAVP